MKIQFVLLSALLVTASEAASASKPVCGASSSSKVTRLLSPVNPPRTCVYTINASSSRVCQLRFDLTYNLAQPSLPAANNNRTYAECADDSLVIGDFKLCGTETNQHLYVPLNRTGGVKSFSIEINTAVRIGGLGPAIWDITVRQLECPSGSPLRSIEPRAASNDGFLIAPPGCSQYYPQQSGAVMSFNYKNGVGVYPGNLNYAICFRRTTETKALTLTTLNFKLGYSGFTNYDGLNQTDAACYSQIPTVGHNEDYLLIPQAKVVEKGLRATYFCGASLSNLNVVSTAPGPLEIIFHSDNVYRAPEIGFYFLYSLE